MLIQSGLHPDEASALITMIKRSPLDKQSILIADMSKKKDGSI